MKRLTRTEWYQSIAWVLDSTSPLKPAWLTSPVALYRNLIETNRELVWSWSECSTFSALMQVWKAPIDQPLFVVKPAHNAFYRLDPPLSDVGDDLELLLDYSEMVVLEPHSRFIGLLDAQCRQCCTTIPTVEPEVIRFYSVADLYGEFSNFAPYPIHLDGYMWPTTEHYLQAHKFIGTPHFNHIRLAPTPMEAARAGRDRRRPLRKDWESVKRDVMRQALWAKFTQHPSLTTLLLSTGNAKLVEHTSNDAFWGDGGDGRGQNWLGRLLMELRHNLRHQGR